MAVHQLEEMDRNWSGSATGYPFQAEFTKSPLVAPPSHRFTLAKPAHVSIWQHSSAFLLIGQSNIQDGVSCTGNAQLEGAHNCLEGRKLNLH
jgi:hypothetical protein